MKLSLLTYGSHGIEVQMSATLALVRSLTHTQLAFAVTQDGTQSTKVKWLTVIVFPARLLTSVLRLKKNQCKLTSLFSSLIFEVTFL